MPDSDGAGGFPARRAPLREYKTEDVVVAATAGQAAYLAGLRRQARALQPEPCAATLRRIQSVPAVTDLMLNVVISERMANMDLRLAGRPMDGPGKIAAAAAQIAGQARQRDGLQVVFCELGLYDHKLADLPPETPPSWNVQIELAGELEAHGIHSGKVRFASMPILRKIGAAAELDTGCRIGTVKVLVTDTIAIRELPAAGDLVTAVHHLDVPFSLEDAQLRDAALARDGAPALRQFRYITSGYAEAAGWLALAQGREPVQAAQDALAGSPLADARQAAASPRPHRRTRPGPPAPGQVIPKLQRAAK